MSDKNDFKLMPTGRKDGYTHYRMIPVEVANVIRNSMAEEYGADSNTIIDDNQEGGPSINVAHFTQKGRTYTYVNWGLDNQKPYNVKHSLGESMIATQCLAFNIKCCYGQGVRFVDREQRKDVDNPEISDFCLRNSLQRVFLEQTTDIKHWFWSVVVIVLSRDGSKVVAVRPRDAMYCRLEYAPDTPSGNIEHVFFADWRVGHFKENEVEIIPLLDRWDPLGDLMVRMGREADPLTGKIRVATKERKFAILTQMPTPGCQYYPSPYYMSVFRDAWLDIYRLIGIGKRYMIKNTSAPRVQIEVHNDYWDNVCDNENIMEPEARKKRIEQEKQNIMEFVTGVENAGKALISGYYVDPNGKENRMVRITQLNDPAKKEGGNWSDDMEEASNALCFAFGVHPNLVGATPGKSQMNNSGSDKRELFTLAQATEKLFHEMMLIPYHVILHYNEWHKKATIDVPMIMLTTLDENKDAKKVTNQNNNDDGDKHNKIGF